MKKLSTLCFFLMITITFLGAQVPQKTATELSGIIGINEVVDFKGIEIKFKKVIRDSRCPKSVMCVRAGEADVLVSIYKNGNFIKEEEISISASGAVTAQNAIFENNDIKIFGFALTPYPITPDKIRQEDYNLELRSQAFRKE